MREIKFRIFCKKTKEFKYFKLDYLLCMIDVIPKFKKLPFLDFVYPDDYEDPQQYTGLKDKNNNEIYEGDILSSNLETKKQFLGNVIYDKDRSCFAILHLKKNPWQLIKGFIENMSVIGNIYQDSHLLDG